MGIRGINWSSVTGDGWLWVIIARSRAIASETVTGECHWLIRRDNDRSMPSSSSVRTRKSPYRSSPKDEANEVRSPSRLAAIARLAIPPGHEPMPSAGISVPADGSADSPVSTMSRYTVPCITTSKSSAVSGSMTRSMPPPAPHVSGDSPRRYIPFCSSTTEIER